MKTNDTIRLNYFNQGADALEALGLQERGYVCPICRLLFDHAQLRNGDLTIEDVPPKSVGGKALLLTCRTCNNSAGHLYENHLKLREDVFRQAQGLMGLSEGVIGHFQQTIGDTKINVDVVRSSGSVSIRVSKKNNPRDLISSRKALESFEKGSKFQLTTGKSYIPNKAALADQKTAFLLIGAKFGYTYFLRKRVNLVREQIYSGLKTGDDTILQYIKTDAKLGNNIAIDERAGIAFLELNSRIVGMPWISHPESNFKSRLQDAAQQELKTKLIAWPEKFEAILDFNEN